MSGTDPRNFTYRAVANLAFTLSANDMVVNVTGMTADRIVTVPAGSADLTGRSFILVKDAAAFAAVITPASGTIDGAASVTLAASAIHGRIIVCDGTNWFTVASF